MIQFANSQSQLLTSAHPKTPVPPLVWNKHKPHEVLSLVNKTASTHLSYQHRTLCISNNNIYVNLFIII